jgi:hypothetical protein
MMTPNENEFGEQAANEFAAAAQQPAGDAASEAQTTEAATDGLNEQIASAVEAAGVPTEAQAGVEGLLGKVAGMLPEGALDKASSLLDRDGDGNPINDIAGLAGKFLGR